MARCPDTPSEGGGTWAVAGWYPDRGARYMSSWGIRMELIRIALHAPSHQGEGSLHLAHTDGPPCDAQHSSFHPGKNSVRPTFHLLRISHIRMGEEDPDRRGGRFNFPGQTCPDPLIGYFTSGYLIARWERRTFQLPRQSNSEDFSSEDERLGSSSLEVKKAEDTSWTRIRWHHCQGLLRGHESAETPIGNQSLIHWQICFPMASGFMSCMYPNKRMYDQYRNAFWTGFGFRSNGYDSRTSGHSWLTIDNRHINGGQPDSRINEILFKESTHCKTKRRHNHVLKETTVMVIEISSTRNVFYFPQGHIEQLEASMHQGLDQKMPSFNLPSKILCK
ncbi:Auxin response factor 1 [Vitis vinifera]|uniref:Auxin response factor 1 n=1 Tax=Vitis vinifera TaxID=29760 RepID=A0A438JRV0_VITVI|nr:Auxin response factor 1 [Vitis vinifera]